MAEIHRTLSFLSMAPTSAGAYRSTMRRFMLAGALVLPGCTPPPHAASPTTAPPTAAFAGALVSPSTPAPTGDDLYARLIGSWSVDVTDYGDDGSVHRD